MPKRVAEFLAFVLLPFSVFAADNLSPTDRVCAVLRPVLEKLGAEAPKIEVSQDGRDVDVRYRTQKFAIHGISMTGKIDEHTHEEIGPAHDGFRLKMTVEEKEGEPNQADVPQTLREPYWQTDLDIAIIDGTSRQVFWSLSYGSRPDKSILDAIRNALLTLGPRPFPFDMLPKKNN